MSLAWLIASGFVVFALSAIPGGARKVSGLVRYLDHVPLSDIRSCLCRPDDVVSFMREDGLAIAGSIYGTGNTTSQAIILVHGNTPVGRRLPIYKILASELEDMGYLVLTIDLSGFGESGDPFELGTVDALDHSRDVDAAVGYVTRLLDPPEKVYLIGHSGGASSVFRVGIQDPAVDRIVAIGPPRRVESRTGDPEDIEYFWGRAQQTRLRVHGDTFPSWYTREDWLEGVRASDMERHIEYFSTRDHKPLLLIDGELEYEEDRAYLREYFAKIVEPKGYFTVPRSDHYLNTRGFLGLSLYDGEVIDTTVQIIDAWLGKSGGR